MIHVRHHGWLRGLARAGYASRGIVYLIVGVLTVLAAFATNDEVGTRDALARLADSGWGTIVLWVVVVGLVGYIVWRLIQSLLDTDDHGFSPKGLGVRAGLLASAFTYSSLGLYALSLLGIFDRNDDGSTPVLDFFGGIFGFDVIWLVLAVVFAIVSGAHIYKAFTRRYADHFDEAAAPMGFVHPISIIGLTARGLIFALISLLLAIRFFTDYNEQGEPPGLTAVLDWVRSWSGGEYLFMAFGIGLICFAAYSMSEAIWRRINVEDADSPAEQGED